MLSLMKKHMPSLLLLFAPLLASDQPQKEEGQLQLVPQGETYSEIQLVCALCRIIKVTAISINFSNTIVNLHTMKNYDVYDCKFLSSVYFLFIFVL